MQVNPNLPTNPKEFLEYDLKMQNEYFESEERQTIKTTKTGA